MSERNPLKRFEVLQPVNMDGTGSRAVYVEADRVELLPGWAAFYSGPDVLIVALPMKHVHQVREVRRSQQR